MHKAAIQHLSPRALGVLFPSLRPLNLVQCALHERDTFAVLQLHGWSYFPKAHTVFIIVMRDARCSKSFGLVLTCTGTPSHTSSGTGVLRFLIWAVVCIVSWNSISRHHFFASVHELFWGKIMTNVKVNNLWGAIISHSLNLICFVAFDRLSSNKSARNRSQVRRQGLWCEESNHWGKVCLAQCVPIS